MAQQTAELYAGVTQLILNKWHDGLAKKSVLWDGVVKGDGREKFSGGTYLQFPVKLIKNATQGFIAGTGGNVGITPSIQNQYGVLNHKFAYWSTNFSLYDETVANGEEDKIKILAKKLTGSMNDAARLFASATFLGTFDSAGGTQSSYPLQFDGLEDVVVASGSSYAGLTDTDYTDDTSAYLPYISTATTPSYATVADMINTIQSRIQQSEYDPKKIFGLMNAGTFTKFEADIKNSVFFLDTKDLYSVGMNGFRINGVEFYLDAFCPGSGTAASANNYIYIIPQDVFKFHYKFGFDNASPFDVDDLRIPDQPILSTQKFIAGNWVCTNRRLIAVAKTITL
jgi:hypothetical protein